MPTILIPIPVGLLASNPLIVYFFVLVAICCIMLYFLDYFAKFLGYLVEKFSMFRHGIFLFAVWLLIVFFGFIVLILFQTYIIGVIFTDVLLIPLIILVAIPLKKENTGLLENKTHGVRILLGAGAIILILLYRSAARMDLV